MDRKFRLHDEPQRDVIADTVNPKGRFILPIFSEDPIRTYEGGMYYNDVGQEIRYCDGSAWSSIGGGIGTIYTDGIIQGDGSLGDPITLKTPTESAMIPYYDGVSFDYIKFSFDQLSDSGIINPQNLDILYFDGSNWVNTPLLLSSNFSGDGINTPIDFATDLSINSITLPQTSDPSIDFTTAGIRAKSSVLYFSIGGVDKMELGATTLKLNSFGAGALISDSSGNITSSTITNSHVNASANIADTKLATISTAGKVSNSATTATSSNTASAIVARDASGNFSAGTITASLTGTASGNVAKTGDSMSGSLTINSGNLTVSSLGTGIVHSNGSGLFSSSGIVNADVDAGANIADTKLATISTAGKVANSATTATSNNTVSAIVARDVSGNFSAGTITATLTGSASLNVLKSGDTMSGTLTVPSGTSSAPSVKFTGSTGCGISGISDSFQIITNANSRVYVNSSGNVRFSNYGTGIVHSDSSGNLTSSAIVNADVDASANIADTKLATISTAGKVSNSATTATSSNTASAIVARDGSGNFSAGTITANLTGTVTGSASNNVLKSGDTMTGDLQLPAGTSTTPSLKFTSSTTSGLSMVSDAMSVITNGSERVNVGSTGSVKFNNYSTGILHSNNSGVLTSSAIVNADVDASANIADTKLATISTAGKVANSATTATSSNTNSAIVARDGSGNFSAGTITATLTGSASLNVLKAGDTMSGALQIPAGTSTVPSLKFTSSTTTGLSAVSDSLSLITNGGERMNVSSAGNVRLNNYSTGILHSDSSGNLTSSAIVNADVDNSANIADTKLATISTAGKVANSATTATSSNTNSAIVARDGSGNFSAGTITASLTGSASNNVLKAGDTMSGALTVPAGSTSAPSINFTGSTTTGLSATSDVLSVSTAGSERINVGSTGSVKFNNYSTGILHSDSSGVLTSSTIVNADISGSANIADTKLATISTAGKVANSATTATALNTVSAIVARDGSGNFATSMISISNSPSNPTDAVNKQYVDSISSGLVPKDAVSALADSNQTLSGLPTIDSYAMSATERILLNGQTDLVENGIWVVSAGAWSRPTDFDTGDNADNTYVLITNGTVYGGSSWFCTSDTPNAIVDTNELTFVQFSNPSNTSGANIGTGSEIYKEKVGQELRFRTVISDTGLLTITQNANDLTLDLVSSSTNTSSTLVERDGTGNFSAGTITADLTGDVTGNVTGNLTGDVLGNLTGNVTGSASNNVLKAGDTMTGALTLPSIKFSDTTDTSITVVSDVMSLNTDGSERVSIGATGVVSIKNLSTGIVHSDSSGVLTSSAIVNADIDASAGIVDTKLATISTAGKVSNSATTATSSNTNSAIVARDGSGNFSAGTITATLTGSASLNVLKSGDTMSGALQIPSGSSTVPSLKFTGSTSSGMSVVSDAISLISNGTESVNISSAGAVSVKNLSTGIVHSDSSGVLTSSNIVNADIDASAGIVDTKLATISTAGKVANSATTATASNTNSAIVARDSSGNFSAGTITASLTGSASNNVLKAGDTMSGDLQIPAGTSTTPSLKFTSSTTSGLSVVSDAMSLITAGTERMNVGATGVVSIKNLSTGILHSDSSGNLTSSSIVNADIDASAGIVDTKLATISTAGKVANSATTATSSNTNSAIVARDSSGNFSANMITIIGTPSASTDVATKDYVDKSAGLEVKTEAVVASGTDTTLSGEQTIDGVAVVAGDRVLLLNQTSTEENGIWVVSASAWVRPTDFNTGDSALNSFIAISSGSTYVGSTYLCTTPNAIIDTDPITFETFTSSAGSGSATSVGTGAEVYKNKTGVVLNFRSITTGTHITATENTDDIKMEVDATDANTASTIVARDGSGNFSAGTITATLTGNVTGSASNNVLKAGDTMTGALQIPAGTVSAPSINFTGSTNTGIYSATTGEIDLAVKGVKVIKVNDSTTDIATDLKTYDVYIRDPADDSSCSMVFESSTLKVSTGGAVYNLNSSAGLSCTKITNATNLGFKTPTIIIGSLTNGFSSDTSGNIWTTTNGVASCIASSDTGAGTLSAGSLATVPTFSFFDTSDGSIIKTGIGGSSSSFRAFIDGTNIIRYDKDVDIGGGLFENQYFIYNLPGAGSAGILHLSSGSKVTNSLIVNADIDSSASIADSKLATISTAGKVANSATTATSSNTASAIVARDGSGNFTAGTATLSGLTMGGTIAFSSDNAYNIGTTSVKPTNIYSYTSQFDTYCYWRTGGLRSDGNLPFQLNSPYNTNRWFGFGYQDSLGVNQYGGLISAGTGPSATQGFSFRCVDSQNMNFYTGGFTLAAYFDNAQRFNTKTIRPITHNTHDIGASGNTYANGYFTTLYGALGTASQTGITSVGTLSTLTVSGNVSTLNMAGDILPTSSFTRNLGGSSNIFNGIYSNFINLYAPSTATSSLHRLYYNSGSNADGLELICTGSTYAASGAYAPTNSAITTYIGDLNLVNRSASGNIKFYLTSGTSEFARFDKNGTLLIGTTSSDAAYKLIVNGTIKCTSIETTTGFAYYQATSAGSASAPAFRIQDGGSFLCGMYSSAEGNLSFSARQQHVLSLDIAGASTSLVTITAPTSVTNQVGLTLKNTLASTTNGDISLVFKGGNSGANSASIIGGQVDTATYTSYVAGDTFLSFNVSSAGTIGEYMRLDKNYLRIRKLDSSTSNVSTNFLTLQNDYSSANNGEVTGSIKFLNYGSGGGTGYQCSIVGGVSTSGGTSSGYIAFNTCLSSVEGTNKDSEKARINHNGALLINVKTQSSSEKLRVNGTSYFDGIPTFASDVSIGGVITSRSFACYYDSGQTISATAAAYYELRFNSSLSSYGSKITYSYPSSVSRYTVNSAGYYKWTYNVYAYGSSGNTMTVRMRKTTAGPTTTTVSGSVGEAFMTTVTKGMCMTTTGIVLLASSDYLQLQISVDTPDQTLTIPYITFTLEYIN